MFGEAKREICRTSKRRARKLRKRVDHQKEADCNPHQHLGAMAAEKRIEFVRALERGAAELHSVDDELEAARARGHLLPF